MKNFVTCTVTKFFIADPSNCSFYVMLAELDQYVQMFTSAINLGVSLLFAYKIDTRYKFFIANFRSS